MFSLWCLFTWWLLVDSNTIFLISKNVSISKIPKPKCVSGYSEKHFYPPPPQVHHWAQTDIKMQMLISILVLNTKYTYIKLLGSNEPRLLF